MLVEVPRFLTARTSLVVWIVIGAHTVEESRPHSVAHAIHIASTCVQSVPVIVLHAQSLLLRETTLSTATKLLLLARFEQRSAHALVSLVQALLFDDLDVSAVRFHHNDSPVCLRVPVTQHPVYIRLWQATERDHSRLAV